MLNVHKPLLAREVTSRFKLQEAMTVHVNDPRYLSQLTAGSPRFDLDGQPQGEVTEAQAETAAAMLRGEFQKPPSSSPPGHHTPVKIEELPMHANTLKVTAVITDFSKHLNVESLGASTVPVAVEVGGQKVTANLNPKRFRKAQATLKEMNGEAAVIISGELDLAARSIKSAGIAVQPKKTKVVDAGA